MRIKNNYRKKATLLAGILLSANLYAEQTATAASGDKDSTYYLLATIAVVLLMPIVILGRTLLFAVKAYLEKQKKISALPKLILIVFLMSAVTANAQDAPTVVTQQHNTDINLWVLISVILLEIVVILFLALKSVWFIKKLLKEENSAVLEAAATAEKPNIWATLWQRMNKFKPMDKEGELDTGHNYDGIRELNNITPPWFTAAFVLSIIVAIVYMWRYHVSHSAPLMIDEFKIEMAEAAQAQEEYLKKAANLVDEKTVVLLSGSEVDAGKKIFTEKCVACHKADGGGSVGPNLTDDYWLHGGKINDVFKTIKYGVPEKGMISWKDQLSPKQIAQVASFIKSIHGTNPPGAKQAEGELYKDGSAVKTDSLKPSVDTLGTKAK